MAEYNAEKTIKSAVESVQAQGCVDFGERIYMKLRLGVVI